MRLKSFMIAAGAAACDRPCRRWRGAAVRQARGDDPGQGEGADAFSARADGDDPRQFPAGRQGDWPRLARHGEDREARGNDQHARAPSRRAGSRPAPAPTSARPWPSPQSGRTRKDYAAKMTAFQKSAAAFNAAAQGPQCRRGQGGVRRPRQDVQGLPRPLPRGALIRRRAALKRPRGSRCGTCRSACSTGCWSG